MIKGKVPVIAALSLLALAMMVASVSAADITISPGDSIQDAIDSAADGDTIILNPGTYSENGIAISGKSLTIRSASGNRADTIIDGKSTSPRIFTVTDASSLTIEDLTLRNGRGASGGHGGAIYSTGAVTVTSSTITGCQAGGGAWGQDGGDGGAICSTGTVTVASSTIAGCSAGNGGFCDDLFIGYGGDGGAISGDTVIVTSSTITACLAGKGGWDAAYWYPADWWHISRDFKSGGDGGAISGNTVIVTSSTITACSAGDGGDGIESCTDAGYGGDGGHGGDGGAISGNTVTVTSSTITACSAGDGGEGGRYGPAGSNGGDGGYGGDGGAISGNTVTVASSTITACSAGRGGNGNRENPGYGGCGGEGGAIYSRSTVTVTSSTITECFAGDAGEGNKNEWNGAEGEGGAINGTAITVTSSTIAGCSSGRERIGGAFSGDGTISFCRLIYNNAGTAINGTGAGFMAINNWWGSNADPASQTTGTVTSSLWLVLGVDAIPASITTAQTSTIRADLTHDSDGSDTSGLGTVPDGIDAAFSATGGAVSPSSGSTGSGAATTDFSSAATGTETITATVDGQSMSTTVDVSAAPATAAPPATIPPSLSGGGESSDSVSPAPVAGTVNANVGGDSAVSSVTVTGTNVNDVIVTGMQPTGLPSGVPDSDPDAYQYIELESARVGSITGAVISFEVPVSWLEEHGLTTSDIAMNRFVDGQWTTLPTTFDGVKNGIAYYYAESPGFSLFSIIPEEDGAEEEGTRFTCPPCPTCPACTCPDPATGSQDRSGGVVAGQTLSPPPGSPFKGFPLISVLIIVCIIGLVCGIIRIRRWRERKQNPELFRKYD